VANTSKNSYPPADSAKLAGIETGAEVNNISDVDATDLTDAGDSSLHFHSSDRNRANHTGTQTASTISDFDTEVSNNADVTANTAKNSYPSADSTKLAGIEAGAEVNTINSDPSGVTGADQVINIMSLTQAEYDAIGTPNAATFYVITDA
jgi:hypothetical protein